MKIAAVIPARGGSKGIPKKNIYPCGGRPLIDYTFDVASSINFYDVIVSTDMDEVMAAAVVRDFTIVRRPKKLAGDTVLMADVLKHAIKSSSADLFVLLQPTSPLRTVGTVYKAIHGFTTAKDRGYDSLMPVTPISSKIGRIDMGAYSPYFGVGLNRQDMPELYQECGTVFIYKRKWIEKGFPHGKRIKPIIIHYPEALDVDTLDDIRLAEWYLDGIHNSRDRHKP